MIKKSISFKNLNGDDVKQDLYFHYSKAELMDMEVGSSEPMTVKIQKIVDTKSVPDIMQIIKQLILGSYGVKSEDGLYFRKKDNNGVPYSIEFEQSAAYSELLMSLINDENELVRFIEGLIPEDVLAQAKAEINK